MTRFEHVLADRDGPVEYDERVLEIGGSGQQGSTGVEIEIDADVVGVASSRRRHAGELADEDGCVAMAEFDHGQLGVMLESSSTVSRLRWLSHPELHSLELTAVGAGGFLRMRHAMRSALGVSMLAALMVNCRFELAGFSASKWPDPSNSLNEPRTLVTIAWRATNPMRLWVGSIV